MKTVYLIIKKISQILLYEHGCYRVLSFALIVKGLICLYFNLFLCNVETVPLTKKVDFFLYLCYLISLWLPWETSSGSGYCNCIVLCFIVIFHFISM